MLNHGKAIRIVRTARSMTQRDLADLIGCSPGLIGMYETERSLPSISMLARIAASMNVPMHVLDVLAMNLRDYGELSEEQRSGAGRVVLSHLLSKA